MTEFSDFYLGKKKDNITVNLANIKGGIKAEKLNEESFSIFKNILDINSDNIIDNEEIDKFIDEIKNFAKDNNFSMNEAAKYLKAKNLKAIKQEELYKIIQNLANESKNILDSSVITSSNGDKTIFIKYEDNSEETIYPDKTSKTKTIGTNGETITTNKNEKGEKTSEVSVYPDNTKKTTFFENNLLVKEVTEKDGKITTINYEDGSPKSKEIKLGENLEKFVYKNGQELSVYKKEYSVNGNRKEWIETSTQYDDSAKITQVDRKNEGVKPNTHYTETKQETFEYHPNNQVAKHTSETSNNEDRTNSKIIENNKKAITYDENGKRLQLSVNYARKWKDGENDWVEFEPSNYTIKFNKDGNIVGHVRQNETLQTILKSLGLEPGTELYDKFMELNKKQIKSFNHGKVKGFDVGAKIIIPGELEEKAISYYNVDPKEEKRSYAQEHIGHADVRMVPSETITIEKDSNWWNIARENLISLGISHPTKAQIAENFDILVSLNGVVWNMDEPVKKGTQIQVKAKESASLSDKFKMSTYDIKNLKKTYPADKYQIKKVRLNPLTDEWGGEQEGIFAYHIYSKTTGKQVLSVTPSTELYSKDFTVKYYNQTGKVSSEIKFNSYADTQETIYEPKPVKVNLYDTKTGALKSTEYTDPKTNRKWKISNPNSPDKSIIISGKNYWESRKYKNGKLYQRICGGKAEMYDSNGKFAYSITGKDMQIKYPLVNTFSQKLKSNDGAGVIGIINSLNNSSYKCFLAVFQSNNGIDLIDAIKNSKLNSNDKSRALNKIRALINADTKITIPHRTSKATSLQRKGTTYDIKYSGDNLTVKNNKTGEKHTINLPDYLSKCTEFERATLRKIMVEELPGEVLEDLAIETRKVKVSSDMDVRGSNKEAAGFYYSGRDLIELSRKEVYHIEIPDTFLTEIPSSIPEIFVHELGHAVDYNGYLLNTASSGAAEFKDTFEQELKKYIAAGKVQHSWDDDFEIKAEYYTDKNGKSHVDYNSVYATTNEREMFAECYTLLMNGDCQSKEHILKYFPKTYKAFQNLLNEIRQKSPTERYNRVHV